MGYRISLRVKRNEGAARFVPLLAQRRNRELAQVTAQIAREIVAVDTGATRDSIKANGNEVSAGKAAIYLEFGTVFMDAQPFLRPAARMANQRENAKPRGATLFGLL